MTLGQLHLFNSLYLIVLAVVVILTRPTVRRPVGALAGVFAGAAGGIVVAVVCERLAWWHLHTSWEPYYVLQFGVSIALGCFVFLLTWRIMMRPASGRCWPSPRHTASSAWWATEQCGSYPVPPPPTRCSARCGSAPAARRFRQSRPRGS